MRKAIYTRILTIVVLLALSLMAMPLFAARDNDMEHEFAGKIDVYKQAMKDKDSLKASALSFLRSQLKYAMIEKKLDRKLF